MMYLEGLIDWKNRINGQLSILEMKFASNNIPAHEINELSHKKRRYTQLLDEIEREIERVDI